MTERFTLDQFTPLVGQGFRLSYPDYAETLTLVAATPLRFAPGPGLPPGFSLVFVGESRTVMLGQHLYKLDTDGLGRIDLALICIGRESEGNFRYQAIVN
jgi:hypothetical protein